MPFDPTPETLAILLDFDEETFVQFLVDMLAEESDTTPNLTWFYHPDILDKLARIRATLPATWYGIFAPAVRRLRVLWLPDLEAKLDALAAITPYDPFAWTDVRTILARPVQPVRWLVPGLIPDGLTMLGGTPKSGKSYLAYTLAMAVASTGLWAGHFEVDTGKVLFISLEDDEDDTRQRLAEIDPDFDPSLHRWLFLHGQDALPGFAHGLHAWLSHALTTHQPRLVIIDPISYLYANKRGPSSLFEDTKDLLFPLRWLAKQHQCALLCLDHRRKRSKDDVSIFDTLHGSQAKVAVADAILMVEREEQTVTMASLLRRGYDQTLFFDLSFADGRMWCTYKGPGTSATHTESTYGDLRVLVARTLTDADEPLSLEEIALINDLPVERALKQNLWQILHRMIKMREAVKIGKNKYARTGLSTGA